MDSSSHWPVASQVGITQRAEGSARDVSDEVADVDAAFVAGGGIERTLSRGAITIDLRATIGVRNLVEEENVGSLESRGIHLLVGYRF